MKNGFALFHVTTSCYCMVCGYRRFGVICPLHIHGTFLFDYSCHRGEENIPKLFEISDFRGDAVKVLSFLGRYVA
jgi:hypothetical protein